MIIFWFLILSGAIPLGIAASVYYLTKGTKYEEHALLITSTIFLVVGAILFSFGVYIEHNLH